MLQALLLQQLTATADCASETNWIIRLTVDGHMLALARQEHVNVRYRISKHAG